MSKQVKINCKGSRVLPLGDLRPFQGDLKTLTDANYIKLSGLIKSMGFSFPIFVWVDKEHDQTYILDGHQRVRTLQKMADEGYKIPKIPVADVAAGSFKEAKEKLLAAASYFGKVDTQGLYEFVVENDFDPHFLEENFDLPNVNLEDFRHEFFDEPPKEGTGEGDEVPDVDEKDVTVKPGDLYLLGDHLLLCGDCTKAEDVAKLVDSKKVDMMLADPPYGVDYAGKNEFLNNKDKGNRVQRKIANDNIDDYRKFFSDFIRNAPLADYNTCYVFLSGQEMHNLRLAIQDCGFKWSDYLVWAKNNHVLGRKDYNAKHEWITYFWKGRHKFYANGHRTTILEYPKPQKSDLHPTMKPIALLEQLISDGSPEAGTVYEPFAGSGSTLIAAENTGRTSYNIEMEPYYCQVIIERFKNLFPGLPVTRLNMR